jgi:hypothetical protein
VARGMSEDGFSSSTKSLQVHVHVCCFFMWTMHLCFTVRPCFSAS